jgi:hypothetical protein
MRLTADTNVLEAEGTQGSWRSTIEMSSKTFRMLIDEMYSNKIGSIVREIAANAEDSHIRAGAERRFFVHCPEVLDPTFFVRDYGVGMTEEVMTEVYIVVGRSDKEQTNTEVGMWGLGSKAPFAYSDQYAITCYDGEYARHYGYGIDEKGSPILYLMEKEPSIEPRGVRISLAVESNDFPAFHKAIQHTWIAHNGGFDTNIGTAGLIKTSYDGEGWTCLERNDALSGQWYARQGCVIYPIDPQHVRYPNGYRSKEVYILDCPIGTVQITPNREAIQYAPEVVAYLTQRVEGLKAGLRDAIWNAIKDIGPVADFFAAATARKPEWLTLDFVHPPTGLTRPVVDIKPPSILFEATFNAQGRWDFSTKTTIPLGSNAGVVMWDIDDISALLDPSRDGALTGVSSNAWLSKSELRRLSRFARAFLEARQLRSGIFVMNCAWNEDFWRLCFPTAQRTKISFDTLREAVPRRIAPPKVEQKQPIKGIALAKAAGEQKPVFEIGPDDVEGAAWVSSDQYRRHAIGLFKWAKRYGIKALYICAPATSQVVKAAGVPKMVDYVAAILAESQLSLLDLWWFKQELAHHGLKGYVNFLRRLREKAPKTYAKLLAADGAYSAIAAGIDHLLPIKVDDLNDDDVKIISCLMWPDETLGSHKPDFPDSLKKTSEITKSLAASYHNPTVRFVTDISNTTDPQKLKALASALLQLQKLVPPTQSFN